MIITGRCHCGNISFKSDLGAGAIRDSGPRVHLHFLYEARGCVDILPDWLAEDRNHGAVAGFELHVRNKDCPVPHLLQMRRSTRG